MPSPVPPLQRRGTSCTYSPAVAGIGCPPDLWYGGKGCREVPRGIDIYPYTRNNECVYYYYYYYYFMLHTNGCAKCKYIHVIYHYDNIRRDSRRSLKGVGLYIMAGDLDVSSPTLVSEETPRRALHTCRPVLFCFFLNYTSLSVIAAYAQKKKWFHPFV